MSRTAARITQADVARVIRAAKQAGAGAVDVRPDGTITIRIAADSVEKPDVPVAEIGEIVL